MKRGKYRLDETAWSVRLETGRPVHRVNTYRQHRRRACPKFQSVRDTSTIPRKLAPSAAYHVHRPNCNSKESMRRLVSQTISDLSNKTKELCAPYIRRVNARGWRFDRRSKRRRVHFTKLRHRPGSHPAFRPRPVPQIRPKSFRPSVYARAVNN